MTTWADAKVAFSIIQKKFEAAHLYAPVTRFKCRYDTEESTKCLLFQDIFLEDFYFPRSQVIRRIHFLLYIH